MGRKNTKYHKTLYQLAYERLSSMQAFGESKRKAKEDGTYHDKIFSGATYDTYWKHIKRYLKWIQKNYPECTTLKASKRHINEYLQMQVDAGMSAWTVHTKTAALHKLYGIRPEDPNRFTPPTRHREEIKRSRGSVARDKHFSVTNNLELIQFVQGTGTRRAVLEKLEGRDLWSRQQMLEETARLEAREATLSSKERSHLQTLKDALDTFSEEKSFLHHRRDKGGKYRYAPIIGPNKQKIIERMRNTAPNDRVWQYVHSGADVHGYRGEYATVLYKWYARPITQIPYDKVNRGSGRLYQSEVYVCRADERGKKLDKRAMYMVSKALGHNRLNVVADHYIRGL